LIDVTDEASIADAVAQISDLDILVNNAGINTDGDAAPAADVDSFRRTYETNALATPPRRQGRDIIGHVTRCVHRSHPSPPPDQVGANSGPVTADGAATKTMAARTRTYRETAYRARHAISGFRRLDCGRRIIDCNRHANRARRSLSTRRSRELERTLLERPRASGSAHRCDRTLIDERVEVSRSAREPGDS
jgi:NAD(P)-dependent dehydrogenase (short-subunit alcohol dehydrogenase family)